MHKSIHSLREQRAELLDTCEAFTNRARGAGRELTAAESKQCDEILDVQIPALDAEIAAEQAAFEAMCQKNGTTPGMTGGLVSSTSRPKPGGWRDAAGNPIRVYGRGEPLSTREPKVSLGEIAACMVTGRGSPEIRAALSEGSNSQGGFLVPDELSRRVIDKARAASVMFQAGAGVVPMSTETLDIARVETDPTFTVVGEHQEIPSVDMTFGMVHMRAEKIACIITLSRELGDDAANLASLVEDTLARAFAVELDRLMLVGTGTGGDALNGLVERAEIDETGSIGAITWEDILAAAVAVRAGNHRPNAYVCSPTIEGDLAALREDGATGAFLAPPLLVSELARLSTSNCPDANLIVGNFEHVLVGLRQGLLLEVSNKAGDAFKKHQLLIKATWRGDMAVTQNAAFHRLAGITT